MKERFFNKKRNIEVPDSKALAPDIEKIKEALCKSYNIKEGELLYSKRGERNEARNIAMYLTRQLRGNKLTEIGKEYKVSNYSTVSTIIERMKNRIKKERRIRKRVNALMDELKVSQEQTPYTGIIPVVDIFVTAELLVVGTACGGANAEFSLRSRPTCCRR